MDDGSAWRAAVVLPLIVSPHLLSQESKIDLPSDRRLAVNGHRDAQVGGQRFTNSPVWLLG